MFGVIVTVAVFGVVSGRGYENHERINLVANTVGPFNNPTETYPVR